MGDYVVSEIKCQRCSPSDDGCATCGGYKVVLRQLACACGTKYWVRPDAITIYNRKRWHSTDGLELIAGAGVIKCKNCRD